MNSTLKIVNLLYDRYQRWYWKGRLITTGMIRLEYLRTHNGIPAEASYFEARKIIDACPLTEFDFPVTDLKLSIDDFSIKQGWMNPVPQVPAMATSGASGQNVEADRACLSATNDQQAVPTLRCWMIWLRQLICIHGPLRDEKVWVVNTPTYREFGYDHYCTRCGKLVYKTRQG